MKNATIAPLAGNVRLPGKRKHMIPLHIMMTAFSILCVLPIILVISISFSRDKDILVNGYSVPPMNFTLEAYRVLFIYPEQILRAYGITVIVTIAGSIIGLFLTTTLAYAIVRRDYVLSRFTTLFVFITMLFNGGLTATYIWYSKGLSLKDSILVLILPNLVSPFLVLLAKGFFQSIPYSIIESTKIDGASELIIYMRIVLPLSKPGIATLALFIALSYWNDWFTSMLYIDDYKKVSLQYLLIRIMKNIEFINSGIMKGSYASRQAGDMPTISIRMAMCIVAAGPMLCVFPFFQKYFVKGLTIGSVKG